MITYEEAIRILRDLKSSAASVDWKGNSVFKTYRDRAESEMCEIIGTLLKLDLGGKILCPGETEERPLIGRLRDLKECAIAADGCQQGVSVGDTWKAENLKMIMVETLLELDLDKKASCSLEAVKTEDDDYKSFLLDCDYIIGHVKELKELFEYRSYDVLVINCISALHSIYSLSFTTYSVEFFLEDIVGWEMEAVESVSLEELILFDNYERRVHFSADFSGCIANCDWIIEHMKELKALLADRPGPVSLVNQTRVAYALKTIRVALDNIEVFLNKIVLPANPV